MANQAKDEILSLERCDEEIKTVAHLLRNGHTDIPGLAMALHDWSTEKKLIQQEEYREFLAQKSQGGIMAGFDPVWMPSFLFDFQSALVSWAVRKGKAAIFADCGLGKTPMQLVWAENVVRKTNKPVLIITPLAVGSQTIREAEKFGMSAQTFAKWDKSSVAIVVTNYERLSHANPDDFAGVVLDESSILKSFDGARRLEITEFMRTRPYRLLCTATAAPNDYIELGTSAEALGELGYTDMLGRFFKNDQNTIKPMRYTGFGSPRGAPENGAHTDKWRFKGHAEIPFWQWVCSWARAIRRPSDLGFDNGRFTLPELIENQHLVTTEKLADGMLFAIPAVGLKEQREERKRSIEERCHKIADLVCTKDPALIWCHLNAEGDLLADIVKGGIQVSGDDSDEEKEEKFLAFTSGEIRALITKPKIGAWGLNFQHCNHVTFFPSHSFEQYYQGVRRCWRYGQAKSVRVDIVTTEGEQSVMENLQRKAGQADKMFSALVDQMQNALHIKRGSSFENREEIPKWL